MTFNNDIVRLRFRDKASRENKSLLSYYLKKGFLSKDYSIPNPSNFGRTIAQASSAFPVSPTVESDRQTQFSVQVRKKTNHTILPDSVFNPYKQDLIYWGNKKNTLNHQLGPTLNINKFIVKGALGNIWISIKNNAERRKAAQYLYLHAMFVRMVREKANEFEGIDIKIAESISNHRNPAGWFDGKNVTFKIVDRSGKVNNKRTFDVAAYFKDIAYFDEMVLAYDTYEGKDNLTSRIILKMPDIDDNWTGVFNRNISTEFNNNKLATNEFIEAL